jgi:putative lipoic acid-binding regulatory protein
MAERVGFEPTVGLHLRLISSQVHSTTLPPLRGSQPLSKGRYSRRNMEPERIRFPVEYPVKVVARAAPELRARVDAAFQRQFGTIPADKVSERASANSNFVALTYVPVVQSEAQLQALHADLKLVEGVVMVL